MVTQQPLLSAIFAAPTAATASTSCDTLP